VPVRRYSDLVEQGVTHLVTFSDESMSRAAMLCLQSGLVFGAPVQWLFTPRGIRESEFYRQHKALLDQPRGIGFWAWKPYIIQSVMSGNVDGTPTAKDGDILIYADAGVEFINNVSHIIDQMDQDIFLFGNNWEHAHWCKRDVIEAVWPCCPKTDEVATWARFGKQCQASVIFFKVTEYSRWFVAEWLEFCLARGVDGSYLISDEPSFCMNHPEFREHRHDQAILTTLAYREGLKLHWWPASYNDGAFTYEKIAEYADDDYPILFNHHRRRNYEWENAA
jgi:hypothetical protein